MVAASADPSTDPAYASAETALDSCIGVADPISGTGGECSKYFQAINNDCAADTGPVGAAFDTCSTIATNVNNATTQAEYAQANQEWMEIVCGSGISDGGISDGGNGPDLGPPDTGIKDGGGG
jgi:hypothetical protein